MTNLDPVYLRDLATQIGFLSAFLGGFAGTLLAVLLQTNTEKRSGIWVIGACTFSATAFVTSVIGSTRVITMLHPNAPDLVAAGTENDVWRVLTFNSFGLGVYAILITIGLSGWLHSKQAGYVTSSIAALGIILVTSALMGG